MRRPDTLLCGVVAAIQAHLHFYYANLRVGGDEFVCALGDREVRRAPGRFSQIETATKRAHTDQKLSVRFAILCPVDT